MQLIAPRRKNFGTQAATPLPVSDSKSGAGRRLLRRLARTRLASKFFVLAFFVLLAQTAEADTVVRASSEVGAYRDSFATSVLTPTVAARVESPTSGWAVQGRYLVDVVSAASPDVVATASPRWSETRHEGNADVRWKPGAFGVGLGVGSSYTPDYFSRGARGSAIVDLDEHKMWTLSAAFGVSRDTIGRTGTPFSVFSRELDVFSGSLALSRVLGPRTLGIVIVDGFLERGDQSKPYRYVPLFSPADAPRIERGATVDSVARFRTAARPLEQLPLGRERIALTTRIAHRAKGFTIRGEERIYGDSWGLPASTTDLRLFFDVGRRVILGPSLRFHVQGKSDFYRRAYVSNGPSDIPTLRTGDRELGALFSLSSGGNLRVGLGASPEPMSMAVGLLVDGTFTSFADALYVTHRYAMLAALSFETTFR